MQLQATRRVRKVSGAYFVKTEQSLGGVIEFVVIDLMRRQRGVEGELDIGDESCKLQHFRSQNEASTTRTGDSGGFLSRSARRQDAVQKHVLVHRRTEKP